MTAVLTREESVTDVTVGRWKGHRIEVSFGLRRYTSDHQRETIHHDQTPVWWDFTAMGVVFERGRDVAAGQCLDHLLEVTTPAPGWTIDDIRLLHRLWTDWHLNDMRAECAHLTRTWESPDGYRRLRTDGPGTTCPVSGYRMGRAWLVEPLHWRVMAEVRRLLDVAREAQR